MSSYWENLFLEIYNANDAGTKLVVESDVDLDSTKADI
jgi:hypothetical protein